MRQFFWTCILLLVAAPVWGADLAVGDLRLLGLSSDTLALVGAASVLARALARLETWRPVIRVELVEPTPPTTPPTAGAAPASTPAAPALHLVPAAGAAGLALLTLTGGCVSSADVLGDTAPEGLAVAVGCENDPRQWGVRWTTAEDLGWIELFAETPSSSTAATVTDACGLWLTGLSCDEPVAVIGRLYQRLGDVEACGQTSNDGSIPYGSACPAFFDPILCE